MLVLVIVGGGTYLLQESTADRPREKVKVASNESSKPNPTPEPPKEEPKFAPLSERPVRIAIDKIGVDATIEPVGLTDDGLMDAPDSNYLVGWYDQSALAGEDDYAMLLDGHYGTDTIPAVFRELTALEVGDSITVYGENGAKLEYKVVETDQRYTEDVDMEKALNTYGDSEQSLTIITCEGLYDSVNVTYDKRTIVYAERVI